MAAATTSSPKTSPQRPKGLLLVTIRRGAFVAGGDELEEQVRGFGFERDVADLVDDQQRVAAEPDAARPAAGRRGGRRRAGRPTRRRWRTATRCPAWQARIAEPDGQVGLAGAGRAEEDHVLLGGDEVQGAQVGDQVAFAGRGRGRSRTPPGVLRAGNRAARIRPSPPWDSRAETSRCRQAARNSSWVQDSARARSASRGDRLAQRRAPSAPGSGTPARRSTSRPGVVVVRVAISATSPSRRPSSSSAEARCRSRPGRALLDRRRRPPAVGTGPSRGRGAAPGGRGGGRGR